MLSGVPSKSKGGKILSLPALKKFFNIPDSKMTIGNRSPEEIVGMLNYRGLKNTTGKGRILQKILGKKKPALEKAGLHLQMGVGIPELIKKYLKFLSDLQILQEQSYKDHRKKEGKKALF